MPSSSEVGTADLQHIVDLVTRHLDDPQPAAQPRLAATVLLIRPAGEGPEVFLMERKAMMRFAPSKTVFPGGSVDPDDDQVDAVSEDGLTAWSDRLGCSVSTARSLLVAAAREVFEETGVLLAVDAATGAAAHRVASADHADLLAGRRTFDEVLGGLGLQLTTDLLRPWARWLTPVWSPRRYDTHFFVAALPAGHVVEVGDGGGEAVNAGWRSPRAALEDIAVGRTSVLTPTLEALRDLAATDDPWAVATDRDLGMTTFGLQREPDGVRVVIERPDGAVNEIVFVHR